MQGTETLNCIWHTCTITYIVIYKRNNVNRKSLNKKKMNAKRETKHNTIDVVR